MNIKLNSGLACKRYNRSEDWPPVYHIQDKSTLQKDYPWPVVNTHVNSNGTTKCTLNEIVTYDNPQDSSDYLISDEIWRNV
ncbi:hypothetical protein BPOR_0364g00010 [Botrytis porri]|uniref:Uncharacterized protein n=1 Tax=Botrytis porri TaxID=87229 RepID=A0A4Z1KIA1_9HELO|nr:hypothetical protein BPOR_0364g00010 [Botrytis porri]